MIRPRAGGLLEDEDAFQRLPEHGQADRHRRRADLDAHVRSDGKDQGIRQPGDRLVDGPGRVVDLQTHRKVTDRDVAGRNAPQRHGRGHLAGQPGVGHQELRVLAQRLLDEQAHIVGCGLSTSVIAQEERDVLAAETDHALVVGRAESLVGAGLARLLKEEIAAQPLSEHGQRDAGPADPDVAARVEAQRRRRPADGERLVDGKTGVVEREPQGAREGHAGHVETDGSAELACQPLRGRARARNVEDDEAALAVRQRDEVRGAVAEAQRDVAGGDARDRPRRRGAVVRARDLLESEVAAQRLPQDVQLNPDAFDAHVGTGGQIERQRGAADGDPLVDRTRRLVHGDAERAGERDAGDEPAQVDAGAERAREASCGGGLAGQDDQDAGHAGHADGTDAQRAVADRDREAALAHLVDGLLEGEVAVEHDVGDGHVDAGALDPEVRPSRQPGLGSVVEGRRGCLGVQQHGEGAAEADRPEVQGGAEFELAREAAVADQERTAEIEGRKALTERERRRRDVDGDDALSVGTALLLEAEGPGERLAEHDEVEILPLEAQVRAHRQI